jgi:hypothetical protein
MVLDHEIAGLEKTIEGLRTLCELPPDEPPAVSTFAQEMLKYAGLTDVVRMCLQASPVPLAASEIVAKLKDASYPTETLDNPRAAINTILTRLVSAGEVQRKERGETVLYAWIRSTMPPPTRRTFGQRIADRGKAKNDTAVDKFLWGSGEKK